MIKQRRRWLWGGVVATLILLAAGCGAAQGPAAGDDSDLVFDIAMSEGAGDEFQALLSVTNAGNATFGGDENFNGEMVMRDADSGELRASASVVALHELAPGETASPLQWEGELAPGRYELTWGADGYAETTVTFEVVERDGRLMLGATTIGGGQTESDVLVAAARADLAERLGVSETAITLQSVTPTEFRDASLGVPEPDMMYAQVITPGCIIELEVDGETYTYHAAGQRAVLAPEK